MTVIILGADSGRHNGSASSLALFPLLHLQLPSS